MAALILSRNKLMSKFKLLLRCFLVGIVVVCIGIFLVNWSVYKTAQPLIFKADQLPTGYEKGIILGAKVYSDGSLSGMVKDRADTAVALYQQQKIRKILVSGDHGQKNYDEVNAIKDYLLSQHVPKEDIFLDHAGFDTYDTMYRAKAIFQVSSAVIITQDFHLPRAIFVAKKLGLPAVGVPADIQNYGHMERVIVREKLAIVKAWIDVLVHSQPQFLGEVIPITGDSQKSWDRK